MWPVHVCLPLKGDERITEFLYMTEPSVLHKCLYRLPHVSCVPINLRTLFYQNISDNDIWTLAGVRPT